jgi:hypothetical protein
MNESEKIVAAWGNRYDGAVIRVTPLKNPMKFYSFLITLLFLVFTGVCLLLVWTFIIQPFIDKLS